MEDSMTKQISRRDFMKSIGAAGVGLALARCAPSPTPTPIATPATGAIKFTKTQVTVPSFWAAHEIAGAEAAFAKYFTPETGLTVKYDFIAADYHAKVLARLASNDPYDVITSDAYDCPQYVDKGMLLPLNDLIQRDNFDLSDFDAKALEQWTYGDKIYGLTNDMGSNHCYFNLDLFKKAGLEAPKPTDEWTWDQLAEWSEALSVKEGDQVVQYGFAATDSHWVWDNWPNLNGASIWDEKLSKSLMDDPKVIEAFKFYQDLMYKGTGALRPGTIKSGVNDLFLSGQLAIMLDGTWQVGYLRSKQDEVKFNWDVGLPPHNASASDYKISNFTAGWYIPLVAKDHEASWAALKFYASKLFADEVMFKTLSSLPTRKSSLEGHGFYQWPDRPPEGLTPEFYGKLLERGMSMRHIKYDLGSSILASLNKLDLIYSNEEPAEKLLPALAQEITQELKARPWNSG
jgi:multiple sugar transport system substrate-binding protein